MFDAVYVHMLVCVHMHVCMYACMHVEARGLCLSSYPVSIHLLFRQALSWNLELTAMARLAGHQAPRDELVYASLALRRTDVHYLTGLFT